jgi:protein-tyrosine-phosphatase
MARFLAERRARELGLAISAASAGTAAEVGQPMTPEAVKALSSRSIHGVHHVARQLDARMLELSDSTYALTRAHRNLIHAQFPQFSAKVTVLREAAGLPDIDVEDPYGLSQAVYEDCAARIEEALELIIRRNTHAEEHR